MLFPLFFALTSYTVIASPVDFKDSSPNGEAIVAVSYSDPDIKKYFHLELPKVSGATASSTIHNSGDKFLSSFSIASPGKAIAGTGRSFVSASAVNPFMMPFFVGPINVEGLGLNDFALNNWLRGFESYYDPSFAGSGEVMNTVTAINDNGHVYGKVNSVSFDNKAINAN